MNNSKSKKIINYDPQSDVLYLGAGKGKEEEFVEVSPGVNVELDEHGQVLGVEILNASRMFKSVIKSFQKQTIGSTIK
ncbi:MAG: hypothetical protein A2V69_03635 [Candidatus Portnoybacteria bacterium RBG_13_40_8]|uniref:DUF2283 domain-containing protein n=1 Tax=Candidatus Portnoybacteria bacterium RBG_13_40_8 TaxID=1801990 RepID=A0A1G2F4I6_9BACT|nr:MAG: hypothetical protein A2V69_03635 [Candidatus Portnoybacteria bacterium RBG_13_40_8]